MSSTRTTALWEPDITPPDEWLIPSVLYQESISTFAPLPMVKDRDGREAERLRQLLGPIYEPLSLSQLLHPGEHAEQEVLATLAGLIPRLADRAHRQVRRTHDPQLQEWIRRVEGWPRRRNIMAAVPDRYAEQLREAHRRRESAEARHQEFATRVERQQSVVAIALANARSVRNAATGTRRELLGPLLDRRSELLRQRRSDSDPSISKAIDAISEEIQTISNQLASEPQPHQIQEYETAHARLQSMQHAQKALVQEVARADSYVGRCRQDLERARSAVVQPWENEWRSHSWLLQRDDYWSPPRGFDTIAPGKVHGSVFEFLATEGGLWVSKNPDRPYAGTLVGPGFVTRAVLAVLAEWHCAEHPGWVPMSRRTHLNSDDLVDPMSEDDLVTLAISWILPVPATDDIARACAFRQEHDEELFRVREALAQEMPEGALTQADVKDVVMSIKLSIAEPLSEVERALELDRKLRLRHVGETLLFNANGGIRNLAGSLAAGALAAPVIGELPEIPGTLGAVGGGAVISCFALSAAHLWSRRQRRSVVRSVSESPYRYVYNAHHALGAS